MAIENHWEPKGLYTQYINDVSGEDMVNCSLITSGDSRFGKLDYIIGDWREAKFSTVTANDVEVLASCIDAMSRSKANIWNATIMYDDENRRELYAFYSEMVKNIPWKFGIFETLEDAREWVSQKQV